MRPVLSRKQQKNAIESKHRIVRSNFLRLQNADSEKPNELHSVTAVRISNELYGIETVSACELATGHNRPIDGQFSRSIPPEVVTERDTLFVKRELNLIMRTHRTNSPM